MNLEDCKNWYIAVKAVSADGTLSQEFSNWVVGWNRPEVHALSTYIIEQGETKAVTLTGKNFFTGDLVFSRRRSGPSPQVADMTVSDVRCGLVHSNDAHAVGTGILRAPGFYHVDVTNTDLSPDASATEAGVWSPAPGHASLRFVVFSAHRINNRTKHRLAFERAVPRGGTQNVVRGAYAQFSADEPLMAQTVNASTTLLIDGTGNSVPQADNSPEFVGPRTRRPYGSLPRTPWSMAKPTGC